MNHIESVRQSWRRGVEPDLLQVISERSAGMDASAWRGDFLLEAACEDMRERWRIETVRKKFARDYLQEFRTQLESCDDNRIIELLLCEWELRWRDDHPNVFAELAKQHPRHAKGLREQILSSQQYQQMAPAAQRAVWRGSQFDSLATETHDPAITTVNQNSADALATQPPSDRLTDGWPDDRTSDRTPGAKSSSRDTRSQPGGPIPATLGRFRVIRKLGSGAFGDVYLSYDDRLQRHVAIKAPRRETLTRGGNDIAGFLTEARAAASLNHPGIVTTHDVVEQSDGTVLVVMEYVQGGNLQDLIDQQERGESLLRTMGLPMVASIGYQMAQALAEAHHHGLVHRDLKPANLLVTDNKLQITDFGLAITSSQAAERLELAGTPAYMSPEQISRNPAGIDAKSDIWSVGVILYQLATGRLPFEGSLHQLADQIQNHQPVPPRAIDRSIPLPLETIILQCLEKNRDQRFDNILQVADELRPLTAPRDTGCRWECVALPLGIMTTIIGVILGMGAIAALFTTPYSGTSDLRQLGIVSYVFVGFSLGLGPPLIALGNWFCCRRLKWLGAATPNVPCRVSRLAVGCAAAGSATAGWGPPIYLLTLVLGLMAIRDIRRHKRWLTGYKHVLFGLIIGTLFMIPWSVYWWTFAKIHGSLTHLDRFEQHLAEGDLADAKASLTQLEQSRRQFPVNFTMGYANSQLCQARLDLAQGNTQLALDITTGIIETSMIYGSEVLAAYCLRAETYRALGDLQAYRLDRDEVLRDRGTFEVMLPRWADAIRDKLAAEQDSAPEGDWNASPPAPAEDTAPQPPSPFFAPPAVVGTSN
jgi:predicted Ser/Thr protein kinase